MLGHDFQISKRQKIETRIRVVKMPMEKYLEILDKTNSMMCSLTGHKIAKGETNYEKQHVEYTEDHRLNIVKGLEPKQRADLFNDLEILEYAIDSLMDIIEKNSTNSEEEVLA